MPVASLAGDHGVATFTLVVNTVFTPKSDWERRGELDIYQVPLLTAPGDLRLLVLCLSWHLQLCC